MRSGEHRHPRGRAAAAAKLGRDIELAAVVELPTPDATRLQAAKDTGVMQIGNGFIGQAAQLRSSRGTFLQYRYEFARALYERC